MKSFRWIDADVIMQGDDFCIGIQRNMIDGGNLDQFQVLVFPVSLGASAFDKNALIQIELLDHR